MPRPDDSLVTFITDNFSPDDFWDADELAEYADDSIYADYIHESDLPNWARDEGWIPQDEVPDLDINVGVYHDDSGHRGSVTYCSDPVCSALGYLD